MIGIFDSGVGGLSVLREVRKVLPDESFVYFGDSANVPYGGRSDVKIRRLSEAALQVLLRYSPNLVVIACNTATSIAVNQLRLDHPSLPIVGVVPVLKTAASATKTKCVAVLATYATLTSRTYQNLKEQYARDVNVVELALPEWVMFVEHGNVDGDDVRASMSSVAMQVASSKADVAALGCTHFPFLRKTISEAMPRVEVIDSGPAVARQVVRVLTANRALPADGATGGVTYLCSGDPGAFSAIASKLLGEPVVAQHETP